MTTALTTAQFEALPRYENGRIKNLAEVFIFLTNDQVLDLQDDDWSYYQELQEELDYEMSMMMEG